MERLLTPSRARRTRAEYERIKRKARDDSAPPTPVKVGLFAAAEASTASESSGTNSVLEAMEKSLKECAKITELSKKGSREISSAAAAVANKAAKLCHQRYFSDAKSLKELQDMVQRVGLGTEARKGHTIILAILTAANSRGLDISPEDLGLELEDLDLG